MVLVYESEQSSASGLRSRQWYTLLYSYLLVIAIMVISGLFLPEYLSKRSTRRDDIRVRTSERVGTSNNENDNVPARMWILVGSTIATGAMNDTHDYRPEESSSLLQKVYVVDSFSQTLSPWRSTPVPWYVRPLHSSETRFPSYDGYANTVSRGLQRSFAASLVSHWNTLPTFRDTPLVIGTLAYTAAYVANDTCQSGRETVPDWGPGDIRSDTCAMLQTDQNLYAPNNVGLRTRAASDLASLLHRYESSVHVEGILWLLGAEEENLNNTDWRNDILGVIADLRNAVESTTDPVPFWLVQTANDNTLTDILTEITNTDPSLHYLLVDSAVTRDAVTHVPNAKSQHMLGETLALNVIQTLYPTSPS